MSIVKVVGTVPASILVDTETWTIAGGEVYPGIFQFEEPQLVFGETNDFATAIVTEEVLQKAVTVAEEAVASETLDQADWSFES